MLFTFQLQSQCILLSSKGFRAELNVERGIKWADIRSNPPVARVQAPEESLVCSFVGAARCGHFSLCLEFDWDCALGSCVCVCAMWICTFSITNRLRTFQMCSKRSLLIRRPSRLTIDSFLRTAAKTLLTQWL